VFAPVVEVEVEVGKTNARAKGVGLSVAAENGTHVVVSGPRRLLRGLCERLARRGIRTEGLRTSHAFHSGLLDPVLAALEEAGSELSWSTPEIVLVSNVTGRPVGPGEEWDGGYWRRQARERVRFASGVDALAELGVGVLVEVGPGAVLGPLAALGWRSEGGEAPAVVTSVGRETGFVVYIEGMLLTAASGIAGVVLGLAVVWLFFRDGLDISGFMPEDINFGGVAFDPVMIPVIEVKHVVQSVLMTFVIGLSAALYPAWHAARLDPAETVKVD